MLIGEVLREWRYAKRLSIRVAAKRLKIHFSTLSRIENNNAIDSSTMMKLLSVLFGEQK